jgi:hypothetical protein
MSLVRRVTVSAGDDTVADDAARLTINSQRCVTIIHKCQRWYIVTSAGKTYASVQLRDYRGLALGGKPPAPFKLVPSTPCRLCSEACARTEFARHVDMLLNLLSPWSSMNRAASPQLLAALVSGRLMTPSASLTIALSSLALTEIHQMVLDDASKHPGDTVVVHSCPPRMPLKYHYQTIQRHAPERPRDIVSLLPVVRSLCPTCYAGVNPCQRPVSVGLPSAIYPCAGVLKRASRLVGWLADPLVADDDRRFDPRKLGSLQISPKIQHRSAQIKPGGAPAAYPRSKSSVRDAMASAAPSRSVSRCTAGGPL